MKIHFDTHKQAISHVLYVGDITPKTATEFHKLSCQALNKGQKYFPLLINSEGGDVYSLFDMISHIRAIEDIMPVVTYVGGAAFSAGGILAALGTTGYRYISQLGTIMLHDVFSIGESSNHAHDLKANADETKRVSELMWRTLENHILQPKNYFNEMLDKQKHSDMYFNAKMAIKHNLCDHIGVPTYRITSELIEEIE